MAAALMICGRAPITVSIRKGEAMYYAVSCVNAVDMDPLCALRVFGVK
jgi:hypothetical protein